MLKLQLVPSIFRGMISIASIISISQITPAADSANSFNTATWQHLKDGNLASIYVEKKLYATRYDEYSFLRVCIHNNTDREVGVSHGPRLFYPWIWQLNQLPQWQAHGAASFSGRSFEAEERNQENIVAAYKAGKLLKIAPKGDFYYYAAFCKNYRISTGTRRNGKYAVFAMDGYCCVSDGKVAEPFSLAFDDGKPFRQGDVAADLAIDECKIPANAMICAPDLMPLSRLRKESIEAEIKKRMSTTTSIEASGQARASNYNERALQFYRLGDYDKALADCNSGINDNPNLINLYNTRGMVYNALGQYAKAIADLSKIAEPNRYAEAFSNRAFSHLKLKELESAMKDSDNAIMLAASTGLCNDYIIPMYNVKGQIHYALGQYKSAIDDYNKGLSLKPAGFLQPDQIESLQAELYYHQAEAYKKLNQKQNAEQSEHAAADLGYLTEKP